MSGQNTYDGSTGSGTATAVKDRAGDVARQAGSAGKRVTSTAKQGAVEVTQEAKGQVRTLFNEATGQVREQAGEQQQRLAGGVRTASEQLRSMAGSADQSGMAKQVVEQAAGRLESVAGWLEAREPMDILDDVSAFARRRPGVFIAIAAGAGILVGRLIRAVATPPADELDEFAMDSSVGMDSTVGMTDASVGFAGTTGTFPDTTTGLGDGAYTDASVGMDDTTMIIDDDETVVIDDQRTGRGDLGS